MKTFKPAFFSALLYVVYYSGIMFLSGLISMLPNMIISIIFTYNANIRNITTYISLIAVYLIGIFILFYRDGYKKNVNYDNDKILNRFIMSAIISYAIYYLMGIIIYISGWTNFTVIHSPTYIYIILGAVEIEDLTFRMINISFLIAIIPIFISSLLGFIAGKSKREKTRKNIINESKNK